MRGFAARSRDIATRLLCDDAGQDLIEYALLTAAVGVATIATWPLVASAIKAAYISLDTNTQGLWEPPSPGGTP